MKPRALKRGYWQLRLHAGATAAAEYVQPRVLPITRAVSCCAACTRLHLQHFCGIWKQSQCTQAAALPGGLHAACTAAAGFAAVTALAIAELSATEAIAACASCLLCRGLFSCSPTVRVRDRRAWMQQRCSVGRMMCAQLPLDSPL